MQRAAPYFVTTFYRFIRLENVPEVELALNAMAEKLGIVGLLVLGAEGLNATLAAPSEETRAELEAWIRSYFQLETQLFKHSTAPGAPFRRFTVKIRDEIVTLGTPDLFPENNQKNHHLTPTEWNKVLKEEDDFVLIDTRNWYETKIGTFKGAVDPKIDQFTEFPDWIATQEIPKNKKMLIFCTGGIRCEKGILELQRQGYDNVHQLEGGILKYLEEYPEDQFEGECFVFDHRVAVDQTLNPSQTYKLCPHCGQPASLDINCKRCDSDAKICSSCAELAWIQETCSKNCAYQFEKFPDRKGKKQMPTFLMRS